VSVAYAASLVTPMEGPIKTALLRQGIDFQGQGAGSKMLANLIASGDSAPDVFISVDPRIVTGLGDKVDHATTFGSTSLGIAWSSASKHATLFEHVAAGKSALIAALETPGLKIGRTDPTLDPKGVYTLEGMTILAGAATERRILGEPLNAAQIYPEEVLLTRIELGQEDVGFFYKTEALSRRLHFLPLPGPAAMNGKITFTLAVLKAAPHPVQARVFENFVLAGQGKIILQKAGIAYFHPLRPLDMVAYGISRKSNR
jgi:molybdate/tungstate transport system substrate-binding protein